MRAARILFAFLVVTGLGTPAQAATRTFRPDNVTRALAPAALQPGDWGLLLEFAVEPPYGTLYTLVYDFGEGLDVDSLSVELAQGDGQPCRARVATVDVALHRDRYELTLFRPDASGLVSLPRTHVYKVGLTIEQSVGPWWTGVCIARLKGYIADSLPPPDDDDGGDDPLDPVPTPPEGFDFAGSIPYTGGLCDQESIILFPTTKIDAFWVRIPRFCSAVRIVGAGVSIGGDTSPWRRNSSDFAIYESDDPAGVRADAVVLSLDGPEGLRCDLPVYVHRTSIQ